MKWTKKFRRRNNLKNRIVETILPTADLTLSIYNQRGCGWGVDSNPTRKELKSRRIYAPTRIEVIQNNESKVFYIL